MGKILIEIPMEINKAPKYIFLLCIKSSPFKHKKRIEIVIWHKCKLSLKNLNIKTQIINLKIFELLSDKISFGNQLYKRFQVLEIKKIFKEIQINFAKNKGKKLNGYMIIAKNKS